MQRNHISKEKEIERGKGKGRASRGCFNEREEQANWNNRKKGMGRENGKMRRYLGDP